MNKFGCRTLEGVELEQAKQEATYIDRIPSAYARNVPRPHGECQPVGRRHESANDLYGGKK